MKRCTHCGKDKKDEDFYPYRSWCKKCCSEHQMEWARQHPEKMREYRIKHRPQQRAYYRRWYAEKGRKRKSDYLAIIKSWQESHPAARRAIAAVKYAIKTGRLQRAKQCSACGRKNTRLHAHHPDYKKPLKICWLCASCHKLIHLSICNKSLQNAS